MIFFHWKMNLAYHDARYVDNYEETMYNALLGSLDLDGKHFYYTNPLDARMARSEWHVCPCCVGNIPRTLLMVPTWTYAKAPDGVYVNMYIGSTITLENAGGTDVEMVQKTDYPWSGKIALTVNPKTPKRFAVRLRIPNRTTSKLYTPSPEVNGIVSLAVNGKPVPVEIDKGYAVVVHDWKQGDRIDLELPLKPQRITAAPQLASTRGKVALRSGPLVYNVEAVDQDITKPLDPNAPLTAAWRADLLGGVTVIEGKYAGGTQDAGGPELRARQSKPRPSRRGRAPRGRRVPLHGPDSAEARRSPARRGSRTRAATNLHRLAPERLAARETERNVLHIRAPDAHPLANGAATKGSGHSPTTGRGPDESIPLSA